MPKGKLRVPSAAGTGSSWLPYSARVGGTASSREIKSLALSPSPPTLSLPLSRTFFLSLSLYRALALSLSVVRACFIVLLSFPIFVIVVLVIVSVIIIDGMLTILLIVLMLLIIIIVLILIFNSSTYTIVVVVVGPLSLLLSLSLILCGYLHYHYYHYSLVLCCYHYYYYHLYPSFLYCYHHYHHPHFYILSVSNRRHGLSSPTCLVQLILVNASLRLTVLPEVRRRCLCSCGLVILPFPDFLTKQNCLSPAIRFQGWVGRRRSPFVGCSDPLLCLCLFPFSIVQETEVLQDVHVLLLLLSTPAVFWG